MEGALTLLIKGYSDIPSIAQKQKNAYQKIIAQMTLRDAYRVIKNQKNGQFYARLKDAKGRLLGQHPEPFNTKAEAEALCDELAAWSANERAIIVEHLLLRPKFPGDALYPVCSEGACTLCGDEDPYSFRLTVVMPSWTVPYNTNMEMRRFAERTIREETPAHLLAKICWVGNDSFNDPPGDAIINDLIELLDKTGSVSEDDDPAKIREQAKSIFDVFRRVFKEFYKDKTLFPIEFKKTEDLETVFKQVTADQIGASTTALMPALTPVMVTYFQQLALNGWQFERFEEAWRQWLEANAKIDWTEECLQEQLQTLLTANLVKGSADFCQCSAEILSAYGMAFFQWMNGIMADRKIPQPWNADEFNGFEPVTIALAEEGSAILPAFCFDTVFKSGTSATIQTLLDTHYTGYREVSYSLRQVVTLLAGLRNTYPEATLHDYDDGSDLNPVRLDNTALGSLQAES